MLEVTGNLWHYHNHGRWVVITTNGDVNRNGQAIMGRGVALQAKTKFPDLPLELAYHLKANGNVLAGFNKYRIISFPVKHHWNARADIDLIRKSAEALARAWVSEDTLYLPRPGCGNGQLAWTDVKPVLAPLLDNRFVVVEAFP